MGEKRKNRHRTSGKLKRVHVEIDADLHSNLGALARGAGLSIAQAVETLIAGELRRRERRVAQMQDRQQKAAQVLCKSEDSAFISQ